MTMIVETGTMSLPSADIAKLEEQTVKMGGMDRQQLLNFIYDLQREPEWRGDANKCCDYFDDNQYDSQVLKDLDADGIPPIIVNVIKPAVLAAVGLEIKGRRDWRVNFDDDGASEQTAIALSYKMKEAERRSFADEAISSAYESQIKAGLGWVEICRESNPYLYKYRVRAVHRREMWWDWRAKDQYLNDARFLVRKQFFDKDVLKATFPAFTDLIQGTINGFEVMLANLQQRDDTGLAKAFDDQRDFNISTEYWLDTRRERAAVFEMWYRVWKRGFVIKLDDDNVIEVDTNNPVMAQAIVAGALRPEMCVYPKMRKSIWIGPHRIYDQWSEEPHPHFPYVPFWGFREDLTMKPYGIIRSMIPIQDEVNARKTKFIRSINSKGIMVEGDAIDEKQNSHAEVMEEINRPDHYIVLKSGGLNKIRIDYNQPNAAEQLQGLEMAKAEAPLVPGLKSINQGERGGVSSGYALNTLVEQSENNLAKLNERRDAGRHRVGELLFAHIKADSLDDHEVVVGDIRPRKIRLNQPVTDPRTQMTTIQNDVAASKLKLILEDVPTSTTFRQQQMVSISEAVKAIQSPQAQALLTPMLLELSDIPNRKQLADQLRRMLNIPDPNDQNAQDPAAQAAQQQIQQLTQQLQDAMKQLKDQAEERASRERIAAETNTARVQVAEIGAQSKVQTISTQAQIDQQAEFAKAERELHGTLLDHHLSSAVAADQQTGADQNAMAEQANQKQLIDMMMKLLQPLIKKVDETDQAMLNIEQSLAQLVKQEQQEAA